MKMKKYLKTSVAFLMAASCLMASGCDFVNKFLPGKEENPSKEEPAAVIGDMLTQETDYTVVIPSNYTKTEEY